MYPVAYPGRTTTNYQRRSNEIPGVFYHLQACEYEIIGKRSSKLNSRVKVTRLGASPSITAITATVVKKSSIAC